jgi:hypothetical protein
MLESKWIATAWPLHVLLGLVLRLRAVLGLCVLRLRANYYAQPHFVRRWMLDFFILGFFQY